MGGSNPLCYRRATSSLVVRRRPFLHAYGVRRILAHSTSASRTPAEDDRRKASDIEHPAEQTPVPTSTSISIQTTETGPGIETAAGTKDQNESPPGLIRKVRPFYRPQAHRQRDGWVEETQHSPQLHIDYFSVLQGKPGTVGQESRSHDSNQPVVKVRPRKDHWFWEFPVRANRTSVSPAVREDILNTIAKPTTLKASKEGTRFAHAVYTVRKLAKELGCPIPSRRAEERDAYLTLLTYEYEGELEHPDWSYNINELFRLKEDEELRHYSLPTAGKWRMLKVQDWDTVASWATALTSKCSELSSCQYAQLWRNNAPIKERGERWANIALWLLLNSPQHAPAFVRATCYGAKRPPFKMVSECLAYCHSYHRHLFEASPTTVEQYHRHISLCLAPPRWPSICPSELGIRLYLRTCNPDQLKGAFDYIDRWDIAVSPQFLLYFVDRLTRTKRLRDALDILHRITTSETNRSDDFDFQISKRCRKLLTFDTVCDNGDGARGFWIFRRILDMGIRPDRAMLNVVIQNALRNDDHMLLWDLYGFLAQGDGIDSYTAVSLLESVRRCYDVDRLVSVLQAISDRPDLLHQRHVLSKLLNTVKTFSLDPECRQFPSTEMFNEMLKYYRQVHDVQPLLDLGIDIDIVPDNEGSSRPAPSDYRSPPSQHALVSMIFAYLQCEIDYNLIRHVLHRFLSLVAQGHSGIAPLAEKDYVFNALLMGMTRHKPLLRECVKLVEGMLHPAGNMAPLRTHPRHRIQYAQPTLRTWTILLRAFLFHDQPQAALKIRETMKKRGIELNLASWNVLVRGFARAQRSKEVAACLKMMERENISWDRHTEAAVGLLRNKGQFHRARREMNEALGDGSNADEEPSTGDCNQLENGKDENQKDASLRAVAWGDTDAAFGGDTSESAELGDQRDEDAKDVDSGRVSEGVFKSIGRLFGRPW